MPSVFLVMWINTKGLFSLLFKSFPLGPATLFCTQQVLHMYFLACNE